MLKNLLTLAFILALAGGGCRPTSQHAGQVDGPALEDIRLELEALDEELEERAQEWRLRWVGDFWLPGEFERMLEEKMRQRKTPAQDNV
jgi:hypothetical protein